MILLKNMTLKNLALTAISFLSVLMSVFAFAFGIIGNNLQAPITAFSWVFNGVKHHSWELSGFGTFLVTFAFGIALGSLVFFVASLFFAKDKKTYVKMLRFASLISFAATLILMIGGFIVVAAYNRMMFGPFASKALLFVSKAFIPCIINAILTAGYFGADMVLGD